MTASKKISRGISQIRVPAMDGGAPPANICSPAVKGLKTPIGRTRAIIRIIKAIVRRASHSIAEGPSDLVFSVFAIYCFLWQ